MPVQFVLGRAGSGKTHHLLGEMIALLKSDPLGPPIYWLLPKQATFEAERLLTARLDAFSRIRVVSFDQLGKDILTHCGDVDMPEVTTLGRRMVIGHLLRVHQKRLKYYSASAHRPGLAAELDSTFGEFDRAGLDISALAELLKKLDADDRSQPTLVDKLRDLHLLLDAYNQYIGQARIDPARRISLILKRVADCSLLKEALLFVDDFYDFSAHERRLLTAVATVAPRTVISLLLDADSPAVTHPDAILSDLSVFHRTERTYRGLLYAFKEAGMPVLTPVLLRENRRYVATALVGIERNLFRDFQAQSKPLRYAEEPDVRSSDPALQRSSETGLAVERLEAPDIRAEVDAVARRVQSAVSGGMRYRQVGVLVRDLADYQQIIHASFTEHGLPYFADHRRTAAHHPLLQMVRSALLIARHRWPHEAVMVLVKSGLAGLNDDQADELENYVLKHRIRGHRWESNDPWAFARDLIRDEDEAGLPVLSDSDRIDLTRRSVVEKLQPILELGHSARPLKVREIASRIFLSLEAFGVRAILEKWMNTAEQAGDLERRGEHEQVWSEFAQLFDHMVDLLGDEPISLEDFIAVMDSGLESFDLALTPVKADQILVGQIDRTRAPELKMVFVLGLNEGNFPRAEQDRCVITDRERRSLRSRNVDLDHDGAQQLLDERFLAYLAFTRAAERLVLTRSTADARGRATNPSGFLEEVQRLFPALATEVVSRDSRQIGTQRQMVSGLLRWARSGAETSDALWPALYQSLAEAPQNALRDRVWSALRYDNSAQLQGATANSLFASPLMARVSQLETMAECPFKHFARYGLKLRDRDEPQVTGIDLSNAYHDILEQLVKDVLETKQDWCGIEPERATEMIRIHAAEIGRRLRGELMLSTARNRYLLDRIERQLALAVASMCEVSRRGKYRPTHAALSFGEGKTLPAYQVMTPRGQQLQLQGRIDRVDMNSKRAGFVVLDYKLKGGPLAMQRVYHGLSLQLLTYLLVIQANAEQLVGRSLTPAAAFLLQLLRSTQPVDHPSEAMPSTDPDFHLAVKPRGLVETRALQSLDNQLTEGHSKVIGAYVKKDGDLGFKNNSDVVAQAEFEALLVHVDQRLGELADQIFAGNVAVAPYMMNGLTPCPHCEYRSVCRFEPGINRYRPLPSMKREEVLRVVQSAE